MSNEIAQLWQQHQGATFPADCRGEEVDGIDLVMLDADTAGCISCFLTSSGQLDSKRREILVACRRDLDQVLPQLQGHASVYYGRLRALAEAVLKALR